MRPTHIAIIAGIISLFAVTTGVSAEEKKEYKAPGATSKQILHQLGLAAGEKFEAKVIRIDMPAGYKGGKHYHTGDLIVYVQSGSLTTESAKGTHIYRAGEVFYEIPGETMRAVNDSTDEDTVLIVFQVGKQGEPLMVKAD